jgi:hypothetical protein
MKDPEENILTSTDKLLALKNKIQVWKKQLSSGNTEMFPLLLQIEDQSDYKEVIPLLTYQSFGITDRQPRTILPLSSEMYDWVRHPFAAFS